MPRAQTGITPLPPKNALILSFRVDDLPLKAMSIGHIAANVPGLVNEMRATATDSDLLYSIGFGSLLWNFIWQGIMPPGFRPLELDEESDELIDDDDEDESSSGADLIFCFSSSDTDLLHQLAEESQAHLKNIARVHEMISADLVLNPASNSPVEKEKTTASVLIAPEYPDFTQSSFLFTLGLAHASRTYSKLSPAEQETLSRNLARDFNSLTEEESGLIHHLYSCKTGNERGHYLLALSDRVDPFQKILDSGQSHLRNMEMTPALYFLPSLEILAALRMGTLRMGPLSPTAKWK